MGDTDETPQTKGQIPRPAIPIMLHKKQIRSGGRTLTLDRKRISQVDFLEVSPPAADGSYTARVSFHHKQTGGDLRILAIVTYKIRKTRSAKGIVVESWPVVSVGLPTTE